MAQLDEDPLDRRRLQLGDERRGVGRPVENVAADDEVGRRRLGQLPVGSYHGHVLLRRDQVAHALGGLDRGDPVEPVGQRRRVAPGPGADIDQRPVRLEPGLQQLQEPVPAVVGGGGEAAGPLVPVPGVVEARGLRLAGFDEPPPVLRPVGLQQRVQGAKYFVTAARPDIPRLCTGYPQIGPAYPKM